MMLKKFLALLLCGGMLLAGCGSITDGARAGGTIETDPIEADAAETDSTETGSVQNVPEETCVHELSTESNVIEHDPVGYCGNTVTKITATFPEQPDGAVWEKDFWGSDSVALTDLLQFLDYSEYTCDCMPEYRVDTEFGENYGINLTEGYARHGDGQVSLTEEQLREIKDIIERQRSEE